MSRALELLLGLAWVTAAWLVIAKLLGNLMQPLITLLEGIRIV